MRQQVAGYDRPHLRYGRNQVLLPLVQSMGVLLGMRVHAALSFYLLPSGDGAQICSRLGLVNGKNDRHAIIDCDGRDDARMTFGLMRRFVYRPSPSMMSSGLRYECFIEMICSKRLRFAPKSVSKKSSAVLRSTQTRSDST